MSNKEILRHKKTFYWVSSCFFLEWIFLFFFIERFSVWSWSGVTEVLPIKVNLGKVSAKSTMTSLFVLSKIFHVSYNQVKHNTLAYACTLYLNKGFEASICKDFLVTPWFYVVPKGLIFDTINFAQFLQQ